MAKAWLVHYNVKNTKTSYSEERCFDTEKEARKYAEELCVCSNVISVMVREIQFECIYLIDYKGGKK